MDTIAVSGSALSEAWTSQRRIDSFNKYLLLLREDTDSLSFNAPEEDPFSHEHPPIVDPTSFFASKKLVLELLYPKLEDLAELNTSWMKKANGGGTQISLERFQSLLSAVLMGFLLLPQLDDLNSSQSANLEPLLTNLAEQSITIANKSVEPSAFNNLILRITRSLIPSLTTTGFTKFQRDNAGLLRMLSSVCNLLERHEEEQNSNEVDLMDIDSEFGSQASRSSSSDSKTNLPRRNQQLRLSSQAFYMDTRMRLRLLRMINNDESQIGLVPEDYVEEFVSLSDNEIVLCQRLLIEIFTGDLVISQEATLKVVERLGEIVSQLEFQCCEVALTLCLEVMTGARSIWQEDNRRLSTSVGDLYHYFVKTCLHSNFFSPQVQVSMANLLFDLLHADPEYGTRLDLDSCRTTLLRILSDGPMLVKYFISNKITGIFDLYILKLHDDVFLDVLDHLPKDPDNAAGIAFRLLVLAKTAYRWSTLLRRCTYHIFETPGRVAQSMKYATRCVANLSAALSLESPMELFHLFSRQLLYTWLDSDKMMDIPFLIFGFPSLAHLLSSVQAEVVGLLIMRGHEQAFAQLVEIMGTSESDVIKKNLSTSLAYSMIYGDVIGGEEQGRGERYIEEVLGNATLMELRHVNFVDIVSLFFDLIDQDNAIEKTFNKQRDLVYAGQIMKAIKDLSHSSAELPPNQQPMFKARYLVTEIRRLCDQTVYEFSDLWTPALVVSIARSLFNTVNPALGSLHACSALRKVRILICMAGPVCVSSYALEMLLNSMRSFMVDPECADDALGMSQFLLLGGSEYLAQTPSFLAGYALSALASLRVFLESSQASTTQESQFKATMSKAKEFHTWLTEYLTNYHSPIFKSRAQEESFRSITESAAHIRSSGNAEKGTAESKLLLSILRDGAAEETLLNEPSRHLALGLLCNDFAIPVRSLEDIIESDEDALKFSAEIWKSCTSQDLSDSYLAWAGRALGRSFSASGDIPEDILQEAKLERYQELAPEAGNSETGLLNILQDLLSNPDSHTAGLAESALRRIISLAISRKEEQLVAACQQTLSEPLFIASQWAEYKSPPSENQATGSIEDGHMIWTQDIASPRWLQKLSIHLALAVPESVVLSGLPLLLSKINGFAANAFPFIVHLVLLLQQDQQQTIKRSFSGALKAWLSSTARDAKEIIKLLINTVLYLRTREYPKESSIADRGQWLDFDYSLLSSAATSCGMFKSALLFAELAASETTRTSRRSSAVRETDLNDCLLTIFENIDDPDAYYGLPEDASLATVLARVEYENEGTKSLAFRGAQFDSHLRLRNAGSVSDAETLMKALSTLGLSGLSHALVQTQESNGTPPTSLESTFESAQRLEMWNLPAPSGSDHHAVVVYKAFQTLHHARDISSVRSAIYEGFQRTMQALITPGMNATAVRRRLGAVASLAELDDVMNMSDPSDVESVLGKFTNRRDWMQSGL
jgi:serine-protein kinase ATM